MALGPICAVERRYSGRIFPEAPEHLGMNKNALQCINTCTEHGKPVKEPVNVQPALGGLRQAHVASPLIPIAFAACSTCALHKTRKNNTRRRQTAPSAQNDNMGKIRIDIRNAANLRARLISFIQMHLFFSSGAKDTRRGKNRASEL